MNQKWTYQDTETLIKLYRDSPLKAQQIAAKLHRTKASIYGKASSMKIRRAPMRLRRRGFACKRLTDFEEA